MRPLRHCLFVLLAIGLHGRAWAEDDSPPEEIYGSYAAGGRCTQKPRVDVSRSGYFVDSDGGKIGPIPVNYSRAANGSAYEGIELWVYVKSDRTPDGYLEEPLALVFNAGEKAGRLGIELNAAPNTRLSAPLAALVRAKTLQRCQTSPSIAQPSNRGSEDSSQRDAAISASAAARQTAGPPSPVVDVAGLRTGMTEDEYRAALEKAGYPRQNTKIGASTPSTTTHSARSVINNLRGTEFLNSIVGRKYEQGMLTEFVLAAFLGPGNENRAWAISRTVRYAPDEQPSIVATYTALTQKYGAHVEGKPNNTMFWWWDTSGNLLPARPRPECERAIHDTQMYVGNLPTDGHTTNLAAMRAPPFPGIARSDCAYGVRATAWLDARGNVTSLNVLAVALKDANSASIATARLVGELSAAEHQKAKAAADARRPDL